MKKKTFGLLLIIALLLISSLVGTSNVYAEENIAHNLTIEDYKDFLLENDLEVYKEFNELSEEEQKEFVKIISDPETYMNDENWEIVEGVEQYSNEPGTNTYSLLSNTRTYSRYRDYNMTILGITVTGYRISVRYEVVGSRVNRILSRSATVERRLNPMVQTGQTSLNAYVSNNRANAEASFHYSIGPIKGLSQQIGTLRGHIAYNENGSLMRNAWRRD
ncbi:hypothetical protein [Alkalibacterium thalassium]|uniref:DUF5626 domain-containing protein n=1 Tax=Alkalibacterium thalassium TaxID=426701 RepID=A0A1G8ZSQ1_9LACT|nr:hypothetical protein [Alkalibacterium thalassium]SDK18146.1 hypothetical protein SAMN04488098_101617 [Alkalibacterium thalassium]